MKPRLVNSKKWTGLPKEYASQVELVFKEGFAGHLANCKLLVEGRIYSEEILLRVGILEKGRLSQMNFEVSIGYSNEKKDAVERIHNAIDAAASMMNEYFEDPEGADFPLTWKEYDFDQQKIWLQYSTVNSDLEAQANALLGELASPLVVETDLASEDALERAEVNLDADEVEDPYSELIEDDEDDETPPQGPSMFGGAKKKTTPKIH